MFRGRMPSALAFANVKRYKPTPGAKYRFKLVRVETVRPGEMFAIPDHLFQSGFRCRIYSMWYITERTSKDCVMVRAYSERAGSPVTLVCGKYVAVRIG